MALLAKKLTRFFPNKKTYFGGARRDSSTTKGSRYVKIDEESENETEKLSKSHVNKIKCYECKNLRHITINYFSK